MKYNNKAKLVKGLGYGSIGVGTMSGFFVYEGMNDFVELKDAVENFTVVSEQGMKLNPMISIPLIISGVVFLIVMYKKNKDFLKGKATLGVLIATLITYLFYSVINITLASLVGCLAGCIIDEVVCEPLYVKNMKLVDENYQLELEAKKEAKRLAKRKELEALTTDGTV